MNDGMNAATANSDEWETPFWLFDALDAEFGFTLDGVATATNAKLRDFCSEAAHIPWRGHRVFCNPPYSNILPFVDNALGSYSLSVLLLPDRIDSDWYRRLHETQRRLVWRPFRKRIAFCIGGKPVGSPRFGSVVVVVLPSV